jgi:mannose-1-phosphate guanylyltransferase/mannose-6-phosphate isomerase
MDNPPILPVILCGGSGSRLWPLSRKSFPKQYLSINSKRNKTLLQKTQERIMSLKNIKEPVIICNEEHRFIVAEQMREIEVKPNKILLEPFGRNTCPAITLAALKAVENNNDPIILILSSDHHINNNQKFIDSIEVGIKYAIKDRLVTFGVIPDYPATGYGYIKSEQPIKKGVIEGFNIEEFIEKPNEKKAKKLLSDSRYSWNSGIFLFKASTLLKEIKRISPILLETCKKSINKELLDLDFQRVNKEVFKSVPNISFDVAIMEKTNLGTVIPLDSGWSDIGNWNSVWKVSKKDKDSNFTRGNIFLKESKNCYVESENKLIYGLGLSNLIIVQSNDATLIINQNDSEKVKGIVKELTKMNIPEGENHKKIYRPWGNYISIAEDPKWQIKLIVVHPGHSLSLQKHNHRSEHWVVVNGTAKVEIDEEVLILSENESSYIPIGSVHRLSNPGQNPLKLVEVQSGSYLGEDDIIRLKDDYGRI